MNYVLGAFLSVPLLILPASAQMVRMCPPGYHSEMARCAPNFEERHPTIGIPRDFKREHHERILPRRGQNRRMYDNLGEDDL